ncbi:MAG: DUF357 domain-containing protein [Candidatus Micrarchaeales archaeon]|uniref:DUF357 domain-containing protein n=1 Tax=Candidatus Micrarchaeum acidiphilum ARMAN-2 TaxID=425595 RepID=C7DHJ1_MICA2|nr:MAG: Protein of unknown function DUF357 [Candidatus Micrarchaeum acidiphilum ARMAN-2]MCW6160662.1 DUF357 domain-containing protein [Candidatus Micrarchaeales archaeon]
MQGESEARERIEKDIRMFYESVKEAERNAQGDKKALSVIEMSKLYASDSKSYLDKGDLFTSFSCISYAHGLLDAIKSIKEGDE